MVHDPGQEATIVILANRLGETSHVDEMLGRLLESRFPEVVPWPTG